MSILRYLYRNVFDTCTVAVYSSQLEGLPVSNVQNEILSKPWRTESGFVIKSEYNDIFHFKDTSSEAVRGFAIASATYTGSGLATVIQSGMRSVGLFSTHTAVYDSGTGRFTLTKATTATSLALYFAGDDRTMATIIGFDKDTVYSGTTFWNSPKPTKGNQHWANFSATSGFSGSVFVLDRHNLTSGTVMRLRLCNTATHFDGLHAFKRGNGVFKPAINLVDQDFTNWTNSNSTDESSDYYVEGHRFTKVTNVGANTGYVRLDLTGTWTTLTPSFSIIAKKGNSAGNTTQSALYDLPDIRFLFQITIDFDNYPNAPGSPGSGTLHKFRWIDSETVELFIICDSLDALEDNIRMYCYGSDHSTDGEYTYWTAPQAEDNPYPTPWVDGSRAAEHPDETFEMPSQFTIDMIVEPCFIYNTGTNHYFISWYIDSTHRFRFFYAQINDTIRCGWQDGGPVRYLSSQQLDDGSSHTDINQRIRILASIDVSTGAVAVDSRLIVIPLESGALYEDPDGFSDDPDPHVSRFPTASIGHENDLTQADSQFERLRIYAGNLVGTVANSADADALLAIMERKLDLTWRNTDYMRPIATADAFYERSITVNNPRQVTKLTSTQSAKAIQVSWWDGRNAYSEIGRLWLGEYFEPKYHQTNTISFSSKKIKPRSKHFTSEAGVTFFDKKDKLIEYSAPVDPLDEYYDDATKTGYEDMLDDIGNDKCLYITFDAADPHGSTVYVYNVGIVDYKRVKHTTIFGVKDILFREQK